MGSDAPAIVLFRRDLRVADNRALAAAVGTGRQVLPLFVLDEEIAGARPSGAASRWWLHQSLAALGERLGDLGSGLVIRRGETAKVLAGVIDRSGAGAVFWNRRYHPAEAAVDAALKKSLRARGLIAESFDGMLLHEPSLVKTGSGGFYKVYTPFWKALAAGSEPRDPVDAPDSISGSSARVASVPLEELKLLPRKPDWSDGLAERWTPGEEGGRRALAGFLRHRIEGYAEARDLPGRPGTSMLSPHLAFGEITPFQVMAALTRSRMADRNPADAERFRKEIVWREFSYHLLFHNPDFHRENFRREFDGLEWRRDAEGLRRWQRGLTGYPIVDAGMRELWRTGWMHNRVRMIVASFLVKHLGIDWREGEAWFWDTLVDADAANNPVNWQWVAGTGADAAPYFRIFNPVLQGEKFDPSGDYVRRYVPELEKVPDRYIHRPWDAPARVLADSGVSLGDIYPRPIVDHDAARRRALAAFAAIRGGGNDDETGRTKR